MDISVLGPLRMLEDGHAYTPTAPKQRQLLALLLVNAGNVVPASTCVEELWGDAPPNSATATLQSYVLQLRRGLCRVPSIGTLPEARRVLETRDSGYMLAIPGAELDISTFRALVREGRALLHQDKAAAACLLSQALAVWQGPALSDVPLGPVLRAQLSILEEERLSVREQRIDADLGLGYHRELLGELRALVAQQPTGESLHARYMLALYRSGRRAEALEVMKPLRRALDEELGLAPSPWVEDLHRAILACDPVIDY